MEITFKLTLRFPKYYGLLPRIFRDIDPGHYGVKASYIIGFGPAEFRIETWRRYKKGETWRSHLSSNIIKYAE